MVIDCTHCCQVSMLVLGNFGCTLVAILLQLAQLTLTIYPRRSKSSLNCLLIIWVRSCFIYLEGSKWKQLRVFWNLAFYCKLLSGKINTDSMDG